MSDKKRKNVDVPFDKFEMLEKSKKKVRTDKTNKIQKVKVKECKDERQRQTSHSINNLNDLIELAKTYDRKVNKFYNLVNLEKLNLIIPELEELSQMIGLNRLKDEIINQIIYFSSAKIKEDFMYHTVILGPPGVGKTTFAKILSRIYSKLKIVKSDKIVMAKRTDLIDKYLGHTAELTQKTIDSANNGVLFIDEAYSLGNKSDDDIYSKECIDVITQNLSENRTFVLIIAGYKDAIEECFFRVNPGLRRRFSFYFTVDPYDEKELGLIFLDKLRLLDLDILDEEREQIFSLLKMYYHSFKNFAGDMETLSLKCRIAKFRDINNFDPRIITLKNIKSGIDMFKNNVV
jgi:SpoVK/Ycf46/Vps4 family AAA+-type ATPase